MYLCPVTAHMYIFVSVNVFVPYVFVTTGDSIDETSILIGWTVSVPSQGLLLSFAPCVATALACILSMVENPGNNKRRLRVQITSGSPHKLIFPYLRLFWLQWFVQFTYILIFDIFEVWLGLFILGS